MMPFVTFKHYLKKFHTKLEVKILRNNKKINKLKNVCLQ